MLLTIANNEHVRYFATFFIVSGTYTTIGLVIAWCKHGRRTPTSPRLSPSSWRTIAIAVLLTVVSRRSQLRLRNQARYGYPASYGHRAMRQYSQVASMPNCCRAAVH